MPRSKKPSELLVVLAAEVQAAKAAGIKFQAAYRAQKDAERAREAALAQLFHKLGFPDLDAVKSLGPARLRAAIKKRLGTVFEFENSAAANFAFLKTWEGRSPQWKEALINKLGAAFAEQVEANAPAKYSYTLIDPVDEPGPNVIAIPRK